MIRLTVEDPQDGLRLDAFLATRGAVTSAAAARRAIAEGLVRVDGRREKKGARVRAGQVVEVAAPAQPRAAAEVPLVVLYEDADLVAVDKPAGIASQSLRAGETGTMAAALVKRYPECASASEDPRQGGLAHRLDRGTSGVLLAARHREAWGRLRAALGAPDCQKTYRLEVVGAPSPPPGAPDVMGGQPGTWVVSAPVGRIGRRGARVRLGGGRQPLPAETELRIVESRDATTLLEARLHRGRTHQVRAHAAYLGCPVVGDDLYGPAGKDAGPLRLHALSVTVRHPSQERVVHIEAPAPPWASGGRSP